MPIRRIKSLPGDPVPVPFPRNCRVIDHLPAPEGASYSRRSPCLAASGLFR